MQSISFFSLEKRLVADVLGQEGEGSDGERSVPMDKVVMLIWQFRDDPTVVTFMARFVAKVSSVCGFLGGWWDHLVLLFLTLCECLFRLFVSFVC